MTSSLLQHLVYVVLVSTFVAMNIVGFEAYVLDNRMRYAQSDIPAADQLLALATRSTPQVVSPENDYRINRAVHKFHSGKSLDEEDKELLEEFYRETEARDPFFGEISSTDNLWNNEETNGLNTLIDLESPRSLKTKNLEHQKPRDSDSDWTIEPDIMSFKEVHAPEEDEQQDIGKAHYSPIVKLLTSYNPLEDEEALTPVKDGKEPNGDRITGATLFSADRNKKPTVASKSAVDAIMLHNDLLQQPPRDGKVRVRMYYHRAIHDDKKLYGNGPWKYWGHGWGVEFGFDPKSQEKDNFYQKGYTIERAFGRDFCKDRQNCRRPDPDFFKDPRKVGKYSQNYANAKPKYPAKEQYIDR